MVDSVLGMGDSQPTQPTPTDPQRPPDPTALVCPKCNRPLTADHPYCPVDHSITGGVHAVTAGALARTPRAKRHLLGVTIGDAYVINGYLGSGGFGAVYRGEQRALGRDVAIKLLMVDPEVDPEVIARFKREARTAAALLDPNIVTLFDYGETTLSEDEGDRLLYFVMELVHGPTLRQLLKAQKGAGVGLEASLKFGLNVLRGLAAAHQLGVVHRDLKPGNVLIDESKGRRYFARLFDFGISSLQGSGGHTTQLGSGGGVVGTPKYMAPEQWRAQQTAPCTDVYAFGVILAEMLLGRPPVPKMELVEMAAAHCRNARPSVRQTARGEPVPLALTNFIKKCMAIDPRQRYGSAREALDVLNAIDESRERAPIPTVTRFPAPGSRDPEDPSTSLSNSGSFPSASDSISGAFPAASGSISGSLSGPIPTLRPPSEMSPMQAASRPPPPFDAVGQPPPRLSAPMKVAGPPPVVGLSVADTEPELEALVPAPERRPAWRWIAAVALLALAIVVFLWLRGGDPPPIQITQGPASTVPAAPATRVDAATPDAAPVIVDAAVADAAPAVADAAPATSVTDAAPSVAAGSEPPRPKPPRPRVVRPKTPGTVAAAPPTEAPKAPVTTAPARPIQVAAGVQVTPKANPTAADLAAAEAAYRKGVDAQRRGAPKSAQRFFVKALSEGLEGGKARDAQRRIKQIVDRTTLEASEF